MVVLQLKTQILGNPNFPNFSPNFKNPKIRKLIFGHQTRWYRNMFIRARKAPDGSRTGGTPTSSCASAGISGVETTGIDEIHDILRHQAGKLEVVHSYERHGVLKQSIHRTITTRNTKRTRPFPGPLNHYFRFPNFKNP